MKKLIAAMLLLGCGSAQAATVVMDFDDVPLTGDPGSGPETFVYRGFTFESTALHFVIGPYWNGVAALYNCAWCGAIMRDVNNNSFSLHSFDYQSTASGTLSVTGAFVGGGTITQDFSYFPVSGPPVPTSAILDSSWTNLESVEFDHLAPDGFYAGLDNIVVTAVPIPAAVWLFGSGLGLLGWFRRKAA